MQTPADAITANDVSDKVLVQGQGAKLKDQNFYNSSSIPDKARPPHLVIWYTHTWIAVHFESGG